MPQDNGLMTNIIHTETGEIVLTVTQAEFEEFGITIPGHHAVIETGELDEV